MTYKLGGHLTREHIPTEYKDFSEGLGHIGYTKFVLDPTVQPVQRNPRQHQDKVRTKVADLEERYCEESRKTNWVDKQHGCHDDSKENQKLSWPQRSPCFTQMATLDEVLPKLKPKYLFP